MLAVINAKIHTMAGPVIDEGGILMDEEGKIAAVGAMDELDMPEEIKVIDAQGRPVTPGLVEAHCHAGVHEEGLGWEGNDGNESTDPITPHVRAIDGANPEDKAFGDFREAGVTTSQVTPGSANLIGGEQFAVKSKKVAVVEDMVLRWPTGMKAALGENPKRVYGNRDKIPSTRMGNAALMREWLQKARDYADKKAEAEEDEESNGPKFDIKLEALMPVMNGEIPLRIHSHRADDIATAVRVAEEFGLKYTIEHATQAHKIPDFLKEHGVMCAVGPSMYSEGKVEVREIGFETPAVLLEKGVHFCLTNDHPVLHAKYLRTAASIFSSFDVPYDAALKAITLWAAEHIGVDDRVGSLEEGKDGDLVLWSGDPLDARTKAEVTVIDGEVVFEREEQ